MSLDAARTKAFDFALESTKQMITLATGVLAITITFFTDVAGGDSASDTAVLKVAWLLFLASVVLGLFVLMGLTGELEKPPEGEQPSIYDHQIRYFSFAQTVTFGAALVATLWFGLTAL